MHTTLIALLLSCAAPSQAALPPQANLLAKPAATDRPREVRMAGGDIESQPPPKGMVLVPGGDTIVGVEADRVEKLGDRNPTKMAEIAAETPRHVRQVESFYVDSTEVTNLQWKVFLDATGRKPSETLTAIGWPNGRIPAGEEYFPVTNVNLPEIAEYLRWCGKRLPTESEWTRAARGDDDRDYPWGGAWNSKLAQYGASMPPRPVQVGSYPKGASPFGVLDMAGNVFEWTDTAFEPFEGYKPVKYKVSKGREFLTPNFNSTSLVVKGGCYISPREDLRIDRRVSLQPRESDAGVGFRCARSFNDGVETLVHGYGKLLPTRIPSRADLDLQDVFAAEIISYLPDTPVPIVSGYRYLAFAHPSPKRQPGLSAMRRDGRDEPVTLGLLVTSEEMESPRLPPGEYVLAWKVAGESKKHKEKRLAAAKAERKGEEPPATPEAPASDGEGGDGGLAPWPFAKSVSEILEDIDFPQDKDVILFLNVNNAVVGWAPAPEPVEEERSEVEFTHTEGGRQWLIEFSIDTVSRRVPRFQVPIKLRGPGLPVD